MEGRVLRGLESTSRTPHRHGVCCVLRVPLRGGKASPFRGEADGTPSGGPWRGPLFRVAGVGGDAGGRPEGVLARRISGHPHGAPATQSEEAWTPTKPTLSRDREGARNAKGLNWVPAKSQRDGATLTRPSGAIECLRSRNATERRPPGRVVQLSACGVATRRSDVHPAEWCN
jgi:hypothetical protein